jgi:dynein heavy chain
MKNSMEMEDKVDLSFPTIKLNTAAVAKLAELEKQATEIILDNIFEELKKIIAENPKDLLIDLSLFGKIKIKDRKIYHYPSEKAKNSGLITNKKTTIRSLLSKDQIPKKLPTLNDSAQNLPKLEGSFNDSFSKYQIEKPLPLQKNKLSATGEKAEKSGLDHSIVDKLSEKFRINEEGDEYPEMESPTRRYKKHPIALKKEMLGAGLDPLNKDQDFSVMAKTGKNLMAAHFVKPSATKTRYPPIINVFSRTLASPICSSPFPLPLPHRIGSNLSLKCVGLYIHPEKKILMYENTYLHGF